jgi:acyl-coenzyme A synthetase/AMP-(fatty) acid ligase
MSRIMQDTRVETIADGESRFPALLASERLLVRTPCGSLASGELLSSAAAVARSLPDAPAALNLCERRENFLIGFVALLIRGQTCLLPPSRAPAVIAEVVQEHAGSYRLDDGTVAASRHGEENALLDLPDTALDRVVLIGYTSGSTGRPKANRKAWGSFVASTRLNVARVRAALPSEHSRAQPWILATVPSQHMYGMETSVLMPLLGEMGIHGAHPLYPADVAAALEELPRPRILVTTPVHLRALLESAVDLPPVDVVVSSTAPLTRELAEDVERRSGATLVEFFGSTETCVIATRRTAHEAAWTPYPGLALRPFEQGTRVIAPWLPHEIVLQDVLEPGSDGRFMVRGRNADLVEVGGKRASLADLTRRLLSVPGVSDAVYFQPDPSGGAAPKRLAALAVAQGLTEAQVLERLAPLMDPVFLPRPLVLVSQLPRNEVGKLPRDRLLAVLNR